VDHDNKNPMEVHSRQDPGRNNFSDKLKAVRKIIISSCIIQINRYLRSLIILSISEVTRSYHAINFPQRANIEDIEIGVTIIYHVVMMDGAILALIILVCLLFIYSCDHQLYSI
jgi:hypothetical protein